MPDDEVLESCSVFVVYDCEVSEFVGHSFCFSFLTAWASSIFRWA